MKLRFRGTKAASQKPVAEAAPEIGREDGAGVGVEAIAGRGSGN